MIVELATLLPLLTGAGCALWVYVGRREEIERLARRRPAAIREIASKPHRVAGLRQTVTTVADGTILAAVSEVRQLASGRLARRRELTIGQLLGAQESAEADGCQLLTNNVSREAAGEFRADLPMAWASLAYARPMRPEVLAALRTRTLTGEDAWSGSARLPVRESFAAFNRCAAADAMELTMPGHLLFAGPTEARFRAKTQLTLADGDQTVTTSRIRDQVFVGWPEPAEDVYLQVLKVGYASPVATPALHECTRLENSLQPDIRVAQVCLLAGLLLTALLRLALHWDGPAGKKVKRE